MIAGTPISGRSPKIGWNNVFGTVTPSGSAVVALLDTGVDGSHPDLAGQLVPGTSILDGSAGTFDPNGHGTAMAGIIAALTDNGQGIAGIGYAGVKVMPVTVLDANGEGTDSDIIQGVIWAVDHGADVINMSFSNPGFSDALQAAIDYAWAHNVVVVAATGNDGSSTVTFPAGDRGVIGVSNTDQTDALERVVELRRRHVPRRARAPTSRPWRPVAGPRPSRARPRHRPRSPRRPRCCAPRIRLPRTGSSSGAWAGRPRLPGRSIRRGMGGWISSGRMADSGTELVQPAGAAPVGSGGPIVGPYVIAAVADGDHHFERVDHLDNGWSGKRRSAASVFVKNTARQQLDARRDGHICDDNSLVVHVRRQADHDGNTSGTDANESFPITAPAVGVYVQPVPDCRNRLRHDASPGTAFSRTGPCVVDATPPTVSSIAPTTNPDQCCLVGVRGRVQRIRLGRRDEVTSASSRRRGQRAPSITSVSAGPWTTRTVTINTGSGSGTIRLLTSNARRRLPTRSATL